MRIHLSEASDAGTPITADEAERFTSLALAALQEAHPSAVVTADATAYTTSVTRDGLRDHDLKALVQQVWEDGAFWATP